MSQIPGLHGADGLDDGGGDQVQLVVDARHVLQGVEQQRRRRAQQGGGLARDHAAVRQHHGAGGLAGGLRLFQRGGHGGAQLRGDAGLLHHQLQLPHHALIRLPLGALHAAGVVAAQDLHAAGLLTDVVVHDGEARHIHAHVRGGFVGTLALDLLEHGGQHREDLHIPVVVDGGDAVGLQVEGVDHVHVVEVSGSGLVRQIDRVLQGQVPDGERLVLGVASGDAPAVIVVELAQAGGHLAAAGAGRRHHDQGAGRLDIVVAPQSRVGDDVRHVRGVSGDGVVLAAPDAQRVQPLDKGVRRRLPGVLGDDHRAHIEAKVAEHVDEPQHIGVVADAQIAAHLVLFNVTGADGDDDLHVVLQGLQHPDLAVRLEARQHAGGVVVVKQLAAELQIQLAAELGAAGGDVLRL